MIRVLVADDHPIVRAGLRQIIDAAGDMIVVGDAADGRDLIKRARLAKVAFCSSFVG